MMLVFYVQRNREEASVTPEVHKTLGESASNANGHVPSKLVKPNRVRPSGPTEIQTQTILITD